MREIDYINILEILAHAQKSVGAAYLSEASGIPQATVGRRLKELEDLGYLKKESNRGRSMTRKGFAFYEKEKQKQSARSNVDKFANLIINGQQRTLIEVVEIRKQLEAMAVRLACKNADDEMVKVLEDMLQQYTEAVLVGSVEVSDIDLKLHLQIAQYSGNSTLYRILKILLTTDDYFVKFHDMSEELENRSLCISQHREIVQAIKDRDADKAEQKIIDHMNKVRGDVERHYAKS